VGKGVAVPQVALLLQKDPALRMKYPLERFTLGPTPRWCLLYDLVWRRPYTLNVHRTISMFSRYQT